MREAARQGGFKVLYVNKVDRLARRMEWYLDIVHEPQSLDISFKMESVLRTRFPDIWRDRPIPVLERLCAAILNLDNSR